MEDHPLCDIKVGHFRDYLTTPNVFAFDITEVGPTYLSTTMYMRLMASLSQLHARYYEDTILHFAVWPDFLSSPRHGVSSTGT